jgi:glycerophosphoryl diester phosphodiesterase
MPLSYPLLSGSARFVKIHSPVAMMEFYLVAHRGASYDAPENTLAAFNLAWRQGADAIEGDFRLTRDQKIVCIHDGTARRTAGVDRIIEESSLAELRRLDVGSWKGGAGVPERIPTIEEVTATIPPGGKIFIELKCGPHIIRPLKLAVFKSGLRPKQAAVISSDEAVIAEAKKKLPGIKAYWITTYRQDRETGKWSPSLVQMLETLKKIRADGLSSHARCIIDRPFIKAFHKAGMEINVWTVDNPVKALRFKNLGVDSLTTNRPGWLRNKLRELSEMRSSLGRPE